MDIKPSPVEPPVVFYDQLKLKTVNLQLDVPRDPADNLIFTERDFIASLCDVRRSPKFIPDLRSIKPPQAVSPTNKKAGRSSNVSFNKEMFDRA